MSDAGGRGVVPERSLDARLARLHLRGGLLALARAELEQMAGAGTLDLAALADLAEVRWRNGDLAGAAEAASAHLEAGGDEPTAMVICAEALDHDGHLLDARALAARALERVAGQVDRLFAGQPRSGAWSSAGSTPVPLPPGTMTWGGLAGGLEVHHPERAVWAPADGPGTEEPSPGPASGAAPAAASRAATRALPGPIPEPAAGDRAARRELAAIEESVAAERLGDVPERLALLLRTNGDLAASVLAVAERALSVCRDGPRAAALHLVRGDAYRALGRGSDATAAFQRSLRALGARATDKEHR